MEIKRFLTIAAIMTGCAMVQTMTAQEETPRRTDAPQVYDRVFSFHEGLAYVVKGKMQGYINMKGEEVIPPIFDHYLQFDDSPHGFNCGRAIVKKDGKYGYIDHEGHLVIDYIYDFADVFTDGFARVSRDGKWTWIDTNGKEIMPCVFEGNKYSHFDGMQLGGFDISRIWMLVKKDGKYGIRKRTNGEEVIPCEYDEIYQFDGKMAWLCQNGQWGLWIKGRVVVPCEYDSPKLKHTYFRDEGFTRPLLKIYKDDKEGYVDSTGTFIIPCNYDYVHAFDEGLAVVEDINNKQGYVDTTGTIVIPCSYDYAYSFSEGLAMVVKGKKYGYIDKTGRVVIPITRAYYPTLLCNSYPFINGIALTYNQKGYGLIDKKGRQIQPCIYREIFGLMNDPGIVKMFAAKGQKLALMNGDGKLISQFIYTYDGNAPSYSDSLLILKKNNKYVCLDINGQEVLQVDDYEYIGDFVNGLAFVTDKNDKEGIIDKTGRLVFPCGYGDVLDRIYSNNDCLDLIKVEKDKKLGIFTKEGKMIIPCILDKIFVYGEKIAITSNGKHGLIATDGSILLPPEYDYDFFRFHEGLACVVKDKKYGYVDTSYQVVIPCQFDESGEFSEGLAWFRKGNQRGYIDRDGNVVLCFPAQE
jgi:hypothetical protein